MPRPAGHNGHRLTSRHWNKCRKGLQVSGIGSLPYEESLDRLGLTTLQARRERSDMIETYKITTGKVDVKPSIWFPPLASREVAASAKATRMTLTTHSSNYPVP